MEKITQALEAYERAVKAWNESQGVTQRETTRAAAMLRRAELLETIQLTLDILGKV